MTTMPVNVSERAANKIRVTFPGGPLYYGGLYTAQSPWKTPLASVFLRVPGVESVAIDNNGCILVPKEGVTVDQLQPWINQVKARIPANPSLLKMPEIEPFEAKPGQAIKPEIEKFMGERVTPIALMDSAKIELTAYFRPTGDTFIEMTGGCQTCALQRVTKKGVEDRLRQRFGKLIGQVIFKIA